MKAKVELVIDPFHVPKQVRGLVTAQPAPAPAAPVAPHSPVEPQYPYEIGIPLRELDHETLDQLCTEFRQHVFRMAGRSAPSGAKLMREAEEAPAAEDDE